MTGAEQLAATGTIPAGAKLSELLERDDSVMCVGLKSGVRPVNTADDVDCALRSPSLGMLHLLSTGIPTTAKAFYLLSK